MTMKSNRAALLQHSPAPTMSAADVAAHEAASYVRRPRPVTSDEVDAAYRELDEQDLSWATQIPEQVEYELAAGGFR